MTTDSPFSAHLGTKYCPSDEEVLEIKAFLVEPTLRLKNLDDEIADLQKAIDKLKAERDSVESFVDAHKALISPARRLPLDIIQEIFIACLPTHRNCVMSASEAPVLLGRICSSWRAISLSTPRLWSSLHIVDPAPHGDPIGASAVADRVTLRLATTKMWLARSGHCPLSISLKVGFEHSDDEQPLVTRSPFLQLLVQFAPRWQHIHLVTPPAVLEQIRHLTDADVPMLESVTLDATFTMEDDLNAPLEWESLGMLRGARISSFSFPGSHFVPEHLPLKWHQLTTLSMLGSWRTWLPVGLESEAILRALSQCPRLQCCTLIVNDEIVSEIQSEHPVVELAFLNTLEVHCAGNVNQAILFLLPRLSVPMLHKFVLRGHANKPSHHSLAPLVSVWTLLQDFDIQHNIFSKADLLETLRSLPCTIKRLVLGQAHETSVLPASLDDDVLRLLTPSSDSPALCCPGLRTLLIRHGCLISDAALLRLITARTEADTALRRVLVAFTRRMTLDLDAYLTPFMNNGLELSIVYYLGWLTDTSPWRGLNDEPVDGTRAVVGDPNPHLLKW
ncbi:hypothetical protein B0H16DRAFT_1368650 [Mycena metata]|uniref:F-box domain-containing protein n=1 Tax=Mycena metata TaxID=1033252 RepID=A0AAD7JDL9_9AGAR|nr:hypothetical protein B0H16DRAFT_1368650 [Mycena metata]